MQFTNFFFIPFVNQSAIISVAIHALLWVCLYFQVTSNNSILAHLKNCYGDFPMTNGFNCTSLL